MGAGHDSPPAGRRLQFDPAVPIWRHRPRRPPARGPRRRCHDPGGAAGGPWIPRRARERGAVRPLPRRPGLGTGMGPRRQCRRGGSPEPRPTPHRAGRLRDHDRRWQRPGRARRSRRRGAIRRPDGCGHRERRLDLRRRLLRPPHPQDRTRWAGDDGCGRRSHIRSSLRGWSVGGLRRRSGCRSEIRLSPRHRDRRLRRPVCGRGPSAHQADIAFGMGLDLCRGLRARLSGWSCGAGPVLQFA